MAQKSDSRKTKTELLIEIRQLRKQLDNFQKNQILASAKLPNTLELCQIGSWRMDYPSEKFICSQELCDLLNQAGQTQLSFQSFLQAIQPRDRKKFSKNIEILLKLKKPFNQIIHLKNHSVKQKPMIIRVETIKNGKDSYSLIGFVLNTEKIESITNSIEQEKKRYRNLFDLSPTGILLEDDNGTILDANPAFCESLGYQRDELVGQKVDILAPPDARDQVARNIRDLMAGKTLKHNQKSIRRDGSEVYMELRETRVQLSDNNFGILCLAEDFTENKKSQEEHVQKEKLQGILEMAGAVCHELNQPLTTIFITTDLLLDFPEKEKYKDMIEVLKKEAIRISNISEKLMRITKYKTRNYINGIKIVDLDQSVTNSGK
jgi:PAS domain S-box-containing protein